MIKYVKFKEPVSVGGNYADITSWKRDEHGKSIPLTERGNFLVLELAGGDRQRVPMSNVAFIRDDGKDEKRAESTLDAGVAIKQPKPETPKQEARS